MVPEASLDILEPIVGDFAMPLALVAGTALRLAGISRGAMRVPSPSGEGPSQLGECILSQSRNGRREGTRMPEWGG